VREGRRYALFRDHGKSGREGVGDANMEQWWKKEIFRRGGYPTLEKKSAAKRQFGEWHSRYLGNPGLEGLSDSLVVVKQTSSREKGDSRSECFFLTSEEISLLRVQ